MIRPINETRNGNKINDNGCTFIIIDNNINNNDNMNNNNDIMNNNNDKMNSNNRKNNTIQRDKRMITLKPTRGRIRRFHSSSSNYIITTTTTTSPSSSSIFNSSSWLRMINGSSIMIIVILQGLVLMTTMISKVSSLVPINTITPSSYSSLSSSFTSTPTSTISSLTLFSSLAPEREKRDREYYENRKQQYQRRFDNEHYDDDDDNNSMNKKSNKNNKNNQNNNSLSTIHRPQARHLQLLRSGDTRMVENELNRLSISKRMNDALSLYRSIWLLYDNDVNVNNDSNKKGVRRKNVVKPTTRLMNRVIDAIARSTHSGSDTVSMVQTAFDIFDHAVNYGDDSTSNSANSNKRLKLIPNVYTFGSLMSVCAKAGDVERCQDLITIMRDQYSIYPNSVVYSTAISSCERSNPPQPQKAIQLLQNAPKFLDTNEKSLTVVGYNAVLSTLSTAGQWRLAVQLLQEMEDKSVNGRRKRHSKMMEQQQQKEDNYSKLEQAQYPHSSSSSFSSSSSSPSPLLLDPNRITPSPDAITYGTVMAACERSSKWELVLHFANALENRIDPPLQIDGIAITSALHACQQLGMGKRAVRYLEQMKLMSSTRSTASNYHQSSSSDHNNNNYDNNRKIQQQQQQTTATFNDNEDLRVPTRVGGRSAANNNNNNVNNNNININNNRKSFTRGPGAQQRKPLQGPDAVAYRLAISACSRSSTHASTFDDDEGGDENNDNDETMFSSASALTSSSSLSSAAAITSTCQWTEGIRLLNEMEEVTGTPPDVIAYTAAVVGCAEVGEWTRALGLLSEMRNKHGIEPNVVTYSAAIGACARASALAVGREHNHNHNSNHNNNISNSNDGGWNNNYNHNNDIKKKDLIKEPMKVALALLRRMESGRLPAAPNVITYNAAIRACAEGLDSNAAFNLLKDMRARGLQPTVVTYGSLMTACERVGDVGGAGRVFNLMKGGGSSSSAVVSVTMNNDVDTANDDSALDAIIQPNEIIYGAAISCCRKAKHAERAFLLLRKMIAEGLRPNTATFNTVILAFIEDGSDNYDDDSVEDYYNEITMAGNSNNSPETTTPTMIQESSLSSSKLNNKAASLDKAIEVYQLMKQCHKSFKIDNGPNPQTFNIIVRSLALNGRPECAERFLDKMRSDNLVPDVNLFTATVAAYEKRREPMKALRLMESMRRDGYNFYEHRVLDDLFKSVVQLANKIGNGGGLSSSSSSSSSSSKVQSQMSEGITGLGNEDES